MNEVELLEKLVSINSVFPNERQLAEFLESHLQQLGFETKRLELGPGRFNVLAEKKGAGPVVMFYGHMDTVPPYGKWDTDPHTPLVKGDRLYGLGAWDMKSGLAAVLKAVEETTRHVKIAFGCDEENISEGSHVLASTDFLDDVDIIIVPESALNTQGITGPHMITLGRRGRAVYVFEVEGKSAHGGNASAGVNAIIDAAKLAVQLEKLNKRLKGKGPLPRPSQFVRYIKGATDSLSIPEVAVLELDRHMVPPDTPESVLEELRETVKKIRESGKITANVTVSLQKRKTPFLKPYVTPKKDASYKKLRGIVKKKFGRVYCNYGLSVADECVLAQKKPVLTIGTSGDKEHEANEWVSLKSYRDLIGILKEFLES